MVKKLFLFMTIIFFTSCFMDDLFKEDTTDEGSSTSTPTYSSLVSSATVTVVLGGIAGVGNVTLTDRSNSSALITLISSDSTTSNLSYNSTKQLYEGTIGGTSVNDSYTVKVIINDVIYTGIVIAK